MTQNDPLDELVVVIKDGEPCKHPGCLNHVTHKCEECHRIAGKGDIKAPRWSLFLFEGYKKDER